MHAGDKSAYVCQLDKRSEDVILLELDQLALAMGTRQYGLGQAGPFSSMLGGPTYISTAKTDSLYMQGQTYTSSHRERDMWGN